MEAVYNKCRLLVASLFLFVTYITEPDTIPLAIRDFLFLHVLFRCARQALLLP